MYDARSAGSVSGSFFLGVVIGATAAGIAVLLYAPKSGPETRGLLRDEINDTQQMFQRWSNELRDRVDRFGQIIRFRSVSELQPAGNGHDRSPG